MKNSQKIDMGNILVFAETNNHTVPKSSLIAIQAGKDAGCKTIFIDLKFFLKYIIRWKK